MYDHTQCAHHPAVSHEGFESLGVATYRASKIVFDSLQAYTGRHELGRSGYSYGLYGTPTSRTLEAQITGLHAGHATLLFPSGHAAIAGVMLSMLKPGDKVLVPSSVYPPVIAFCQSILSGMGVTHAIYNPMIGSGIEQLIDDDTKLVWIESPGSTTLEVQDMPIIAEIAHRKGALVGCDNTWASPLLCKPLALGADFVVEALTKYAGGHSDVLLGSVTVATEDHAESLFSWLKAMGIGVSPDDCSLVLRGLETMGIRIAHVGRIALSIARRIGLSPAVETVLHPELKNHPGHWQFRRDFKGPSGLFSIRLTPQSVPFLASSLDQMKYFAIGASWGGTRSLIAPITLLSRNNEQICESTYLRISIGLEDPDDLWDDLNTILYELEKKTRQAAPA